MASVVSFKAIWQISVVCFSIFLGVAITATSQQLSTTLPALVGRASAGVVSLQTGSYTISSSEGVRVLSNLTITGASGADDVTLDLSSLPPLPSPNSSFLFTVNANASLRLASLTLKLPPLPSWLGPNPPSMLGHVMAMQLGALVTLSGVKVVVYNCSDFQTFSNLLCRPSAWKYNTTGLQILNGVMMYGMAGMALALADKADGAQTGGTQGATLIGTNVTCPGGLPPPWSCSATYVSSVVELQSRTVSLLSSTTSYLLLSVAANLTLNPGAWKSVDLGNASLAFFGNPAQPTQIDFGGVYSAFFTTAYRHDTVGALRASDLVLVGLPFSPFVTGTLDYFAVWIHAFKVARPSGGQLNSQVILTKCSLVLSGSEMSILKWLFTYVSNALALQSKPGLSRIFTIPATIMTPDDNRMSVLYLEDSDKVTRLVDCVLISTDRYYNGSVSNSTSKLLNWPLSTYYFWGTLQSATWDISYVVVANDSFAGPMVASLTPTENLMARSNANGVPFLSATSDARAPDQNNFGPRYAAPKSSTVQGPPLSQTGSQTFWDLKGVTGEIYLNESSSMVVRYAVLYNLVPGGAMPYGNGFRGGDTPQRLLAYGAGWTPSATPGEVLPSGIWEGLANLTLPLWYFSQDWRTPSMVAPALTRGLQLQNCVVVVPQAEFDVYMYLFQQAGKLPAKKASPPPAAGRRLMQGDATSPPPSSTTVVIPGKADAVLTAMVKNSMVESYNLTTLTFQDLHAGTWYGSNIVLTYTLPSGAPTPLLNYEVTFDPVGYSPPSPLPPASPETPPSPLLPPSLPPPSPTIAPSPPPSSPSPSPSTNIGTSAPPEKATTGPPSPSSSVTSNTSIVGIAVGVSIGVTALAIVLFVVFYRRRRARRYDQRKSSAIDDGADSRLGQPWRKDSDTEALTPGAVGMSADRNGRQPHVYDVGAKKSGGDSQDTGDGTARLTANTAITTTTNMETLMVSEPLPSSGLGSGDPRNRALESLQHQAAAAPTAADTMAMLAAAAAGSRGGSGAATPGTCTYYTVGSSTGPVNPVAAFAAFPQLQLVIVDDDKVPDSQGPDQKAKGAVSTGSQASWDYGGGAKPANSDGTGSGSCISLNLGGKSLLQTMDIESALQAYSDRSQTQGSDVAPVAGRGTHQPDSSPAIAPARAGADLAAAISSLQAELSGRQEQLRITTVLGRGSFGVVYLGTWRGLRVAVKTLVVHDALLGTEGRRRQRAILEAAISTSLHHPNVVSTYAFEVKPLGVVASPAGTQGITLTSNASPSETEGTEGGTPATERIAWESAGDVYKLYIIQEYCDVGTLRDALSNSVVGSVSVGGAAALCALTLALDVACGMCHIHSKNIVHGDLSSANILLTSLKTSPLPGGFTGGSLNVFGSLADAMAIGRPSGARSLAAQVSRLRGLWRPPVVAKVADFGLSVRMGEGQTHASNKFQGTPLYSAPEVLTRGHLTKASDVFSYGVMLLEFYYGSPIADVKARRETGLTYPKDTASIAGGRFGVAMPASCPAHLRNLMVACISPEPGTRPTFEQVVDSLVDLLLSEHILLQKQEISQHQQQGLPGDAGQGQGPGVQQYPGGGVHGAIMEEPGEGE